MFVQKKIRAKLYYINNNFPLRKDFDKIEPYYIHFRLTSFYSLAKGNLSKHPFPKFVCLKELRNCFQFLNFEATEFYVSIFFLIILKQQISIWDCCLFNFHVFFLLKNAVYSPHPTNTSRKHHSRNVRGQLFVHPSCESNIFFPFFFFPCNFCTIPPLSWEMGYFQLWVVPPVFAPERQREGVKSKSSKRSSVMVGDLTTTGLYSGMLLLYEASGSRYSRGRPFGFWRGGRRMMK